MATNCEDVSAQMMELLYGELPSDARATVDAHVAGCARCRSELESFEKTRAAARAGLDEAPPARAHAAIMKAAAAHLATQAQPAAARAAAPARTSFWERIRVRWTFPTFATVGAFAVFLLVNKVFLNPERALESPLAPPAESGESLRTGIPAAPAETPAPSTPAAAGGPAPQSEPPAAVAAKPKYKRSVSDSPLEGLDLDSPASDEKSRRVGGARDSDEGSSQGKKGKKPTVDSLAGSGPPASAFGNAQVGDRDDRSKDSAATGRLQKAERGGGELRFAPPPAQKPAPEVVAGGRNFAPPPPPREAPARLKEVDKAPVARATTEAPRDYQKAPSAAAPAKRRAEFDDNIVAKSAEEKPAAGAGGPGVVGGGASSRSNKSDGYSPGGPTLAMPAAPPSPPPPRPAVAPAPPPPATQAPSPSRAHAKKGGAMDYGNDESAVAQTEAEAKNEKKQVAGGKAGAIETLAQRADRLFTEGRWSEAVAAYRELLRNDPSNPDAKRWRDRLVAAENADLSERQATVAKAKRKAAPSRTESADAEAPQRSADAKASRAPQQAAPRSSKAAAKASEKSSVSDDALK